MTKQDIQARYLNGEIDRKQYEELLRRMHEISFANAEEEKQRHADIALSRRRDSYTAKLRAEGNDKNRAASGQTSTLSSR